MIILIYTSYFAKMRCLQDNVIPISICTKVPDWYDGLQYKKLAPKYDFFMKWKETHDDSYYVQCFKEQVLDKLNATDVVSDLLKLARGSSIEENDICLLCYEKPSDFCHRHLVAKWLNENGFKCEEFIYI